MKQNNQGNLFVDTGKTPPSQLLKWVGNKQKYAPIITAYFPKEYNKYIEPFMGTGAVLAAMAPRHGIAGDVLKTLVELMKLLQKDINKVVSSYEDNWNLYQKNPKGHYLSVLASYNANPNPLDLLFLSRTCYGGVVRFTKEGKMSTPLGPHKPIPPAKFALRAKNWLDRIKNTDFYYQDYRVTMAMASEGDIVYCDPPYVDSQAILYGAQSFKLQDLFKAIKECSDRGAKVALSIDGTKKSGDKLVELNVPVGLFKREVFIDNGSSMLRRLQKSGQIMIGEDVRDRLLLTW